MEDIETRLGEAVRLLRQAAGMTQEQLAQALTSAGWTVRQNTVAKLEGALRPTTVGETVAIASVFEMDLVDLWRLFDRPRSDDERHLQALRQRLAEDRARLKASRAELALAEAEVDQIRDDIDELEREIKAIEGELAGASDDEADEERIVQEAEAEWRAKTAPERLEGWLEGEPTHDNEPADASAEEGRRG